MPSKDLRTAFAQLTRESQGNSQRDAMLNLPCPPSPTAAVTLRRFHSGNPEARESYPRLERRGRAPSEAPA